MHCQHIVCFFSHKFVLQNTMIVGRKPNNQKEQTMSCFNISPCNPRCNNNNNDNRIIIIERGPRGPMGFPGATGPVGPVGPTGPQGPRGLTGPTGATGAQGPQGEVGPQGPIGLTGPQGPTGATGAQGPQGEVGPQGPIGLTGPQGEQGPQGIQGIQGPVGPAGPAGADGTNGLASYGGAYDSGADTIALTTTTTTLPLGTPLPSNGVTTGTDTLTITNAGTYEIDYGIRGSVQTPATVTLSVQQNGADIPQTVVTQTFTTTEDTLTNRTLVTLNAGDQLTLNAVASANTSLVTSDDVNTYLTVKQLTA